MSIIAIEKAFAQDGLNSGELVVLLALADCHNAETGQCNPGIERLSGKTNQSARQVIRNLKRLEDRGLIRIIRIRRDNGLNRSNEYRMTYLYPCDISGNSEPDHVTFSADQYDISGKNPAQNVTLTGSESEVEPEDNLTSEPSATQGKPSHFPQGQEKEESCALASPSSGLQSIALAEAIAAKFPSAGTNYEARYGLYCELTKAFHPQIVPLTGTQYFKKLIGPLDKYAKKLAVAGKADQVSQSIAQMFAVCDDDFPDPDLNASDAENLMASVQQFIQLKLQEPVG